MAQESASSRIPVLLCIDVEPDEFLVNREKPKPWSGFEFTHGYLDGWRSKFEEATGRDARFCWSLRMDPQVVAIAYGKATWVADQYSAYSGRIPQKE